MGVDYSGGMIIGCIGSKILENLDLDNLMADGELVEDFSEWIEYNNFDRMSRWYDCEDEYCYIGHKISNIPVKEMDEEWFKKINELSRDFKALTGIDAELIGTQNIF